LRHKYPESFSKIGVPKNKRHGVEDSLAERLFTPISMSAIENFVRPVMADTGWPANLKIVDCQCLLSMTNRESAQYPVPTG
jgi:hypothetical protein